MPVLRRAGEARANADFHLEGGGSGGGTKERREEELGWGLRESEKPKM